MASVFPYSGEAGLLTTMLKRIDDSYQRRTAVLGLPRPIYSSHCDSKSFLLCAIQILLLTYLLTYYMVGTYCLITIMFCFNGFAFNVQVKHKINSLQIIGFILMFVFYDWPFSHV